MRIEDEALLDYFRHKPKCELCPWGRNNLLEPHHIYCRGVGGGSRLDVALNLIALCHGCHREVQEGGKAGRERCWEVVAAREGLGSWEECQAAIHKLLRTKTWEKRA